MAGMKRFLDKLVCRHHWDSYDLFGVRTCLKCSTVSRRKP